MLLVNIVRNAVRFVKIDPIVSSLVIAGYSLAGQSIGYSLADGINKNDIPSLAMSGGILILGTIPGVISQKRYKRVVDLIERDGFDSAVPYKNLRRIARTYAQEHDLMKYYNSALERHSLQS